MPEPRPDPADVRAVLELLGLHDDRPALRVDAALGVTGVVGLVAGFALLDAAIAVGLGVFLASGLLLGVAGLRLGRVQQLRQLVGRALMGGLPVHETAVTIGGVPSLRGFRFDRWVAHAERRIDEALAELVRHGVRTTSPHGDDSDPWHARARRADQLLAALRELHDAARPGPLRERVAELVRRATEVRQDVQRLTVVGAAAHSSRAAAEAATRVDELLGSMQVAVDAAAGALVVSDRSDGIDTAGTLQDAATTLLAAHEEVATEL